MLSIFSPHLKDDVKMTLEQRIKRAERFMLLMAKTGDRARKEFRERINILIDTQIRDEAVWRAKSAAINEQIRALAVAQVELTKSQKLTDQALRAFINSQRKGRNGNS
jgi:hypothetical protein